MKKKLREFFEMIEDVDVAMMTTRRKDGHLVSRPMAMQKRTKGADLWFVSSDETDKLDELVDDPHVNLSWYKSSSKEWISVAGVAHLSRDLKVIRRLYDASWKIWFPEGEGADSGTPKDPRIILIGVDIHSAVYMEVEKPMPVVLYEVVKGFITREEPDVGKVKRIGPSDLTKPRKTSKATRRKKVASRKKTSGTAKSKKSTAKKASTRKSAKKKSTAKKSTAKKSTTEKKPAKRTGSAKKALPSKSKKSRTRKK